MKIIAIALLALLISGIISPNPSKGGKKNSDSTGRLPIKDASTVELTDAQLLEIKLRNEREANDRHYEQYNDSRFTNYGQYNKGLHYEDYRLIL